MQPSLFRSVPSSRRHIFAEGENAAESLQAYRNFDRFPADFFLRGT